MNATKVWRIVRLAVSYELGLYRSLYRWVFRRPLVRRPDEQIFRYTITLMPVLLAFIGVSAVEVPILHLILPWHTVRLIADAIGIYSVFWMVCLLASMRVHPHIVDDTVMRIRQGMSIEIALPWEAVAAVRTRHRSLPTRKPIQFEDSDAGLVAQIGVLSQTNVDIVLHEPTVVAMPKGTGEPVAEVRIYVDDPDAFAKRARAVLTAAADAELA